MLKKPAILGGEKVRNKPLPAFLPSIAKEEINEVIDTLKSGWISTGPKVQLFQKMIKRYVGCNYTVALNSCTAGLHLSLLAAGVGRGDEVITTPFTFAATVNVILHVGAKPVFVDIQKDTFNIDPSLIEGAITKKTKAIIPVHYGGHPCDMDEILEIAKKHKLVVIEDAAHAIGAKYKNRNVGTIGDFASFSFYATKNITTAEGGMVCAKDKEAAEEIRMMGLHGMDRDAWKRHSKGGYWYYEIKYPGFKYNMTDIQASLGMHQLKKLNKFISKREKISQFYNESFKDLPEITVPTTRKYVKHARHLYSILLDIDRLKIDRSGFFKALDAENIGTSVHFIPVHLHPYYRDKFNFKRGDFPNAEYIFDRIISLPIHPTMTKKDAEDVVKAVRKITLYYRK
ncbi:DegT/DnrJ/EryC1/StrS family aminotransferase [Patescibacteria group bacterium]|nr:DegT/DnrJ/EryC1/StrS family aminotransferase [Patescibacteria group bacterium]